MKKYKIAVCVLTYYPQLEGLMATLYSIIKQKNLVFQIIISDDGSQENCFEEAKKFLDEAGFKDYKFVASEQNRGTVKNLEQALLASEAEYVKAISPGDCLTNETTLSEWIDHLEKSGKRWSFSNAHYYAKDEEGKSVFYPCYANPQLVSPYLHNKDVQCRWNYVILDDIALGAATLCERDLMLRFVQEITDKVKYAEDNMYRLMMFDGYVADFFPQHAILYEYGSGISTSNSDIWQNRLKEDWEATNTIMISRTAVDLLQSRMKKVLVNRQKDGRVLRFVRRVIEKGRVAITLKRYLNKRLTSC